MGKTVRISGDSARFATLIVVLMSCLPDLPADRQSATDTEGGSSGGTPTENDAGSSAGTQPTSNGGAAGSDTPLNLIDNPSFERPDCTSWWWNGATVESVTLARDGELSCRVCAARKEDTVYGLEQSVPVEHLEPGATYVASAWVRAGDGAERAVSTDLRVGLLLDRGPHTSPLDGNQQSIGSLTTSWMLVSKSLTYMPIEGGTHVTFDLVNRAADYGCFLVDDVVLEKMP